MGLGRWSPLLLLVVASLQGPLAGAGILHKTTRIGDFNVEYDVVLPNGYDAAKAYPAVLAFSGGPQTADGNQRMIDTTFRDQAEQRGYIVVVPAAPGGNLFYNGGERIIPEFLRQIMADYRIKGGKFRVAGRSNGGISAFEVASLYPQYFVSVTGFPGYLLFPTTEHVAALSKLCIHMFIGENDERDFTEPMQQQAADFRQRGIALTYSIEKGQSHEIDTLMGPGAARLFDQFDRDQRGCMRDR